MLGKRVVTALVLAPLAVAIVLLLPTSWVALIVAVMCLSAFWEWAALAGLHSGVWRGILLAANAMVLGLLWLLHALPWAWCAIGAGAAFWLLALAWLGNRAWAAAPTRENTALKLLAGELAIAPAWLALVLLHASDPHGHVWTLIALLVIWGADTGAYFVGKRFGKSRLAPHISPNKTRAGAWGAVGTGVAVAAIAAWLLGLRGGAVLLVAALGLLTVAASIVGDLLESLLKRQAGVKDSGTLFPGHGGMLDRVDSMLAALPAFALGKALLDLVG